MFKIGTKIILLASSCRRTTGPRRGSTGFVSDILSETTLHNTEGKMFVSLYVNVIFSRYGFETRNRLEKKKVVTIIPVVNQSTKSKCMEKEAIFELNRRNPSTVISALHHQIKYYYQMPTKASVPMVIAAPVTCDLMICDRKELTAWLKCVLKTSNIPWFGKMLHNKKGLFRDDVLNRKEDWHSIRNMAIEFSMNDRDMPTVCEMLSSELVKKDLLTKIQICGIMCDMNNSYEGAAAYIADHVDNCNRGGFPTAEGLFKIIAQFLFVDAILMDAEKLFETKGKGSKTFKSCVKLAKGLELSARTLEEKRK